MGVQLKNENKLEEMADILEEFHKYVPNHASEGNIVLPDGHTRNFDNTWFHKLLVGGDQLTEARVRGATALRSTHSKSIHLSGWRNTCSGRLACSDDSNEGEYSDCMWSKSVFITWKYNCPVDFKEF